MYSTCTCNVFKIFFIIIFSFLLTATDAPLQLLSKNGITCSLYLTEVILPLMLTMQPLRKGQPSLQRTLPISQKVYNTCTCTFQVFNF